MRKLLVRTYATLLILYGVTNTALLLALFSFKDYFPRELVPYLVHGNYAALLTGLALFKTPLNLVIGYGLLRFRSWARHGILAGIATLPVLMATERLWWGDFRLTPLVAASLISSAAITLVFFTRPSVKELFKGACEYKLIGRSTLLAAGLLLLAFAPLVCSLTIKKMFGKITDAPALRQAAPVTPVHPADGLILIRLLDCSLPVPSDSHLLTYDRIGFSRNPWRFSFRGPQGIFSYENHSVYEGTFEDLPFIDARGYDLERFFLTNQWNPLVLVLRGIGRPQGNEIVVQEVDTGNSKGFITLRDDKVTDGRRKIFMSFALFEKGGRRCVSGFAIIQDIGGSRRNGIPTALISSIRFLEPETLDAAAVHFRNGTELLQGGKKLEGQVELANAHYLAPGRNEYRQAFEATLSKMFRELPHTWNELKAPTMSK